MKYRFFAAFTGALLTVSALSACSNNNTSDYEENTPAVSEDLTSEMTETDAEEATVPVREADTKALSEKSAANRPQLVFAMDNGDYVYSAYKNDSDTPVEVYVRNDHKGKTEELDIPEGSELLYSDGEKLYYYSADDGLCEYDNKRSTPLNKETKSENTVKRDNFFFADDCIYFAVSDDKGTEIRSMDYSGKLSDKVYSTERRNARIVGFYDGKPVCSYDVGTYGYICIFDSEKSSTELKTGNKPYIVGDKVYFIDLNSLCCMPVAGGEEEKLSDERCTDFCFYGDKLIFTDGTSVFSVENGRTTTIFDTEKLNNCDYISGLGITDDKLFVCGSSGSFWKSIAEIDGSGKVAEEIIAGIDR